MGAANGAMLVIISGPSGVGKDTIIDALRRRAHEPEYHYVVTCTTRAMRPGEVDGVDYHFLDRATFKAQREAGEFLEANKVHGNWYGTPRSQVRESLAAGRDVILKIDVQGAQVVKEKIPGALLVFLDPSVARGPLPAPAQPRDRDRRRARAPPAERRDRARPPGGLRLRRDQRDRAGRADRRADRRDHRRGAPTPPGPTGRRLPALALTLSDVLGLEDLPGDERVGVGGSRAVEVAVDAAGGDRTYTYLVPERLARPRARGGRPGRIRATAGARDRPGRGVRLFPPRRPSRSSIASGRTDRCSRR